MLAAQAFRLISKSVIVPSWVYKDRPVKNQDYSFPSPAYQMTFRYLKWLMLKTFLLTRRTRKRKIKHDKKYFSIDNNFKWNPIQFSKSLSEMNRDANQLNIEAFFKRGGFWSVSYCGESLLCLGKFYLIFPVKHFE